MKLFKTLAILILAVSLVLGVALPALAKSNVAVPQSIPLFKSDKGKENGNGNQAKAVIQGKVTAYNTGDNITVQDKSGKSVTLEIIEGKFKILPKGTTVEVGDTVTVISHRAAAPNRPIATQVVVHPPRPPVLQVTGIINNISENSTDNGTITVGTTVLSYNDKTLIALRGALAVKVGQEATVFYRQLDNHTLATRIVIGIKLPAVLKEADKKGKDI